ncbi:selenium metabolism-associated LysR family transcriptional regulator [Virgibacillus sp.]|uniref:selenium metabolism-associated LysR family transcriptional regulator n=1 Tax=Virgibacillus sp. TaxID=1872700 RepID=UPI0025EECCF1|nr:selenium metabolism-associated LysR family transcriptional regulator [Virgibacillus sp.]
MGGWRNVNYERLQTFIAVAEKNSFSEAAKKLFVTQPTITSQIKALEEELQTKLFERTTKTVKLTQSGEILLKYARNIVQLSNLARKEILKIEEKIYGDLKIGCSLTIGEYILPHFLKRFKEKYPLIHMQAKISNSTSIVHHIKDQVVHVGLIETPINDKHIVMHPILEDELCLVTKVDYFPFLEKQITLDQLKNIPLIIRENGSGTREVVEQYLKRAGVSFHDLNIVMELGSTEAIKAVVESGLGASFISKNAILKEKQLGLLTSYSIKNVAFNRHFYLVFRKGQILTSTTELFMDELRKMAIALEGNISTNRLGVV